VSVVLTIVLNLGARAFPRAGERSARRLDDWASAQPSGVRVYFPWKAMLVGSIALTIVLNLLIRR
jgi:hypothetical protein